MKTMTLKAFTNMFGLTWNIQRASEGPWVADIEGLRIIDKEKKESVAVFGSDKKNDKPINALQNLVNKLNSDRYIFCTIFDSNIKLPQLTLN